MLGFEYLSEIKAMWVPGKCWELYLGFTMIELDFGGRAS
jgi:hypothetical protein